MEKETGTGSLMVRMTLARSGQPISGNHHRFIPGNGVIVAGVHASHRHYEMRRRSESPLHGEQKDRCCLDIFFRPPYHRFFRVLQGKLVLDYPAYRGYTRFAEPHLLTESKCRKHFSVPKNYEISLEAWAWIYHGKWIFLRVRRKDRI